MPGIAPERKVAGQAAIPAVGETGGKAVDKIHLSSAARQGSHPGGQLIGISGPRLESAPEGGAGERFKVIGTGKQPLNRRGKTGGVHAIEGEAPAAVDTFAEGAMRGTDAGFAVAEAFQHGQTESLHERGINGEDAVTVGLVQVGLGRRAVVAHRPAGGLQRAEPREGRAAGLRMDQADEAQFEPPAAAPEGFAGLEQREMILAAFD